jgi:hypothetical protein
MPRIGYLTQVRTLAHPVDSSLFPLLGEVIPMVVSAAKREANRRNAQKSSGPQTEEGKKRSKMNSLKHGCRAEILVLPEEDPRELEDQRSLGERDERAQCCRARN